MRRRPTVLEKHPPYTPLLRRANSCSKKQKFYGGKEYEEETYGLREYVLPILLYSVEQFSNSQIRD